VFRLDEEMGRAFPEAGHQMEASYKNPKRATVRE